MTAIAPDTAASRGAGATTTAGRRVLAAVRVHLANYPATLVMPWLIMLAVFGLNVGIWWIIAANASNLEADAFAYNGGVSWIVVYMLVAATTAMSATFRFAVSLSLTRRAYLVGTGAYFAGLSVIYALALTLGAAIERLTDGWGVQGAFFGPFGLNGAPLPQVAYLYFAALLLAFGIGAVFAAVWMRWRVWGLVSSLIAVAAAALAAVWLLTANAWWGALGEFFASTPLATLCTLTLAVTALAWLATYGLLRRAAVGD